MTREEAIKWLKVEASYIEENVGYGKEILEAYDTAIEALEDKEAREQYEKWEAVEEEEAREYFERRKQPCDDHISRQALRQKLQEHYDFFVNAYGGFNNLSLNDKSRVDEITNCIAMVVNEPFVTPQSRWISCSERLPEDLEPVNITWVNHEPEPYYHDIKDKNFVATGIHCRGKWYWYSTTCADYLGEYGENEIDLVDDAIEIVAWMPLPEPMKVGGESK